MKYLFSLLLIGMSFMTVAQNKAEIKKSFHNYTTEQIAELQTKRLAIALELSSAQQKQILKINKNRAIELKKHRESILEKRESGKTISSDERFKMINERLDQILAMQNEMKNILNNDQYELWKNLQNQKKTTYKKGKRQKPGIQKKMRN